MQSYLYISLTAQQAQQKMLEVVQQFPPYLYDTRAQAEAFVIDGQLRFDVIVSRND